MKSQSIFELISVLYLITGVSIFLGPLAIIGIIGFILPAPHQMIESINFVTFGSDAPSPLQNPIFIGLAITAIVGGILGLYGARQIRKNNKVGFKIWFFLASLSIAMTIWNLVYLPRASESASLVLMPSLIWSIILVWILYKNWTNIK